MESSQMMQRITNSDYPLVNFGSIFNVVVGRNCLLFQADTPRVCLFPDHLMVAQLITGKLECMMKQALLFPVFRGSVILRCSSMTLW